MAYRRSGYFGISALAALAVADPVQAAITGPGVQTGHNITAFHNTDFVAVFGYPVGDDVTVDLVRAGHRVASATGPAVDTPDGGALEVNHGPAGAPAPGDCWENATPNVRPGDQIQVRHGTTVEEVTVDRITIDGGPTLVGDVVELRGLAETTAGVPIPATSLDSGEVRNATTRVRANPDEVIQDPLRPNGWIARYNPPYPGVFRNDDNRTGAELRDSILDGDHAMGFGHVVPLPLHSMLVDGVGDVHAPALGCEGSPARENSVGTSSVKTINQAALAAAPGAGDTVVTLGGSAQPGVTAVAATLTDGTTTVTSSSVTPASNLPGGDQGWSASFSRSAIVSLADGALTAAATFTGGTAAGNTMTLQKDVIAPTVSSDPAPGTYQGPKGVTLVAGGATLVTYRTDGTAAGAADTRYAGVPITLEPGSRTITAFARDDAGNVTRTAFPFTITAPPATDPAAPGGTGTAGGTGAAGAAGAPTSAAVAVAAPAGSAATGAALGGLPLARLRLDSLVVRTQLSRGRARSAGVSLLVGVPRGAKVLRVDVLRRSPSGRLVRVARTVRTVDGPALTRIALTSAAVRRALEPGRYVIRVTPGRSGAGFDEPSSASLRVTR